MTAPAKVYATCDGCGHTRRVRDDGTMAPHQRLVTDDPMGTVRSESVRCSGSTRPPREAA